ncbi:hypothetical protein BA177_17285 [Woeseia oceani]|uniref:PLD phosphodiesterase domain-containing protein n=2 Tax=Woeseia oceani TaxID=1548547 RepID=A0A193LLL5_9GAMM|nr:hypothetical protein BA177_17285 [Woeseia oceani]
MPETRNVALLAAFSASLLACSVARIPVSTTATPTIVNEEGVMSTDQAEKVVQTIVKDSPDPTAAAESISMLTSLSETPLYKGNKATLLVDGPRTYAAMLEAIAAARESINIETYIFADDEVGQRFADALIERSRAGVTVRLIYDSIGSWISDEEFFDLLTNAGIQVQEFNGINPLSGGNPLKANNRTHRKLLIVDDAVAFTGGINVSNTYSSASNDRLRKRKDPLLSGWRDTHLAVRGPAVAAFQAAFADNWEGEELTPAAGQFAECKTDGSCDDVVAVLHSEGGDGQESPIYRAYLEAMQRTESRIWITQAYFAPDETFTTLLGDAAARGVDVRLIVPGISDSAAILHASRSRYGKLLERGIRIYETTGTFLHAKTAVIDGVWSTVGSSNLDYRSFLHNDEVNAIVLGPHFGKQMEAQFELDLSDTREVTLEQWKQRPALDRLKEVFSWVVEYWL